MALTRPMENSVFVVTGASGGIGAATSLGLASRGARVVLAARRRSALEEVARRCRAAGGDAIVVPTDVRSLEAVEKLGELAVAHYGHLDGWVNDAAVVCYAPFGEAMPEFRSTIETNLLGVTHGTAVALRHLRDGGVIVTVGSILSEVTVPYLASYNATKHAIRGLNDAIRQELTARGDGRISICTVLPASVDTPMYENAANYTGRQLRPPPPVYSPEWVADRIIRVIERPRPELYLGGAARAAATAWRLMPGVSRRLAARLADRFMFTGATAPPTSGNVMVPTSLPSSVHGGWQGATRPVLALVRAAARSATGLTRARGGRQLSRRRGHVPV